MQPTAPSTATSPPGDRGASADRPGHVSARAGGEPVPGYRLLEPLGRGGFGEVWKCLAPGGLTKAIKFVPSWAASDLSAGGADPREDPSCPARQEREALERVKSLRHPFILSLERVEVVADQLVVIMELADRSLHDLYRQYRDAGQIGLPRDELLGYLLEAAEALDWMNFEHGLQHLDVKPANLFVISGHLKVADFGLVRRVAASPGRTAHADEPSPQGMRGGATPLYSAPELLRGTLSRHSDQYSLAVVYQQLLTGTVPFFHESVYDLMMQHLSAEPDLSGLPEEDRSVVARALAKVPDQRFPSCMEFVQALLGLGLTSGSGSLRRSGVWRQMLMGGRESHASEPISSSPSWQGEPIASLQGTGLPSAPSGGPDAEATSPGRWPLSRKDEAASASGIDHQMLTSTDGVMAAPTAVSLPGYRFTSCLSQSLLGDVWQAVDSQGKSRRALCLLSFIRYDARLIGHLQTLRDPALPSTEVHWSPAERLVILTDWCEGTLRDRFDQHRMAGHPGIPHSELLPLLRSAAEALDSLYARYGILHLGLHPRNLLIDGQGVRVADFGLLPLVWLPTGQPASAVNARYCAPELFERQPSRSADQYSLALIYAEMSTGAHPRPQRPGSGAHRRPEGQSSRPIRPGKPAGLAQRAPKIDLDLLPAPEREVVARALSPDPSRRFESCVAFVEALLAAKHKKVEAAYDELPPVIPYASLLGEPPPPDTVLPNTHQLVLALTKPSDPRKVHGPQNSRYFIQPDGTWLYRLPLALFPGAMQLKVEGFCQHWNGRIVRQEGDSFLLQLELPVPRGFWERFTQPRRLEVSIEVESLGTGPSRLTEAKVRLGYEGDSRDNSDRVLATMAPQVFDSVRLYLQASPEQRTMERWALNDPVHVYPVMPGLELAPTMEGVCRNISYGGIRFRLAEQPPSEHLYLHLHSSPAALGYALLVQVSRLQVTSEGVEIGGCFASAGPTALD